MPGQEFIKYAGAIYKLAARSGVLNEHAVDTLLMYIANDAKDSRNFPALFHVLHDSVWKKLARHVDIGDYNSEAATFATGALAEMAARKYAEEEENNSAKWHVLFPTNVRREVAKALVKEFEDRAGEFDDKYWNERRYKKYHNEPFVEKLNKLLGKSTRGKRGKKEKTMGKKKEKTMGKKVAQFVKFAGHTYKLAHEVSEAGKKGHPDVEYAVKMADGNDKYFKSFDEAAAMAVSVGIARGESQIDVIVSSKAGAKSIGGDDAVEQYNEDPEASVYERFEIKVNSVGRVP